MHVAHRDLQRVKELAFALRRGSIGKARRAGTGGLRGMAGGGEPGSPMRLESQEEDGGSWPPLYGRRPPQVGIIAAHAEARLQLLLRARLCAAGAACTRCADRAHLPRSCQSRQPPFSFHLPTRPCVDSVQSTDTTYYLGFRLILTLSHRVCYHRSQADVRAERFQQWLRLLLYRLMGVLCTLEGAGEGPWAAALSCLVHICTYDGERP